MEPLLKASHNDSIFKPPENGAHYWAQIEGKSATMTEDLLASSANSNTSDSSAWRRTLVFGIAFYLVIALGFAATCLSCNNASVSNNRGQTSRQAITATKYWTYATRD